MMPFVALDGGRAEAAETVALLARLRRGDASALEPLYRREAAAVYRYGLALSANPAWAADAMQDAFVDLAGRPEGYDATRGTLGAYLAGSQYCDHQIVMMSTIWVLPHRKNRARGRAFRHAADPIGSPMEALPLRPQPGDDLRLSLETLVAVHGPAFVLAGCIVRTTAELLLARLPSWRLERVADTETGYPELQIRPEPLKRAP